MYAESAVSIHVVCIILSLEAVVERYHSKLNSQQKVKIHL